MSPVPWKQLAEVLDGVSDDAAEAAVQPAKACMATLELMSDDQAVLGGGVIAAKVRSVNYQ